MKVMVIADHLRGELRPITGELISAGAEVGDHVSVALIAAAPERLANKANLAGADEIITVPVPTTEFDADVYRQAVGSVIRDRKPDLTLIGFNANGISYGPVVAAELGLGFASDVFGVNVVAQELVAERPAYGGKLQSQIGFPDCDGALLLLRGGVWPAAQAEVEAHKSELLISLAPSRLTHIGFVEPSSDEVDITGAPFLLAIGRGAGGRENLPLFQQLADEMGATLVASRPLIDAGILPPARQVGTSGNIVSPRVYLAFGISGATQHVAGILGSRTIIAVNTDSEAPIFEFAQFGVVDDAFTVASELSKLYAESD